MWQHKELPGALEYSGAHTQVPLTINSWFSGQMQVSEVGSITNPGKHSQRPPLSLSFGPQHNPLETLDSPERQTQVSLKNSSLTGQVHSPVTESRVSGVTHVHCAPSKNSFGGQQCPAPSDRNPAAHTQPTAGSLITWFNPQVHSCVFGSLTRVGKQIHCALAASYCSLGGQQTPACILRNPG